MKAWFNFVGNNRGNKIDEVNSKILENEKQGMRELLKIIIRHNYANPFKSPEIFSTTRKKGPIHIRTLHSRIPAPCGTRKIRW
ncbi:hypothetical protein [Gracilibacillus sp. Marseille-QA3620]